MIIERVTITKVDILQSIARKCFFDTFYEVNSKEDMDDYLENKLSIKQLSSELNNPLSHFYIAKINEHYVGYIKLNFGMAQNEFENDNAMEIERLYILQQHHGKKIGQALFSHAMSIADQKRVDYVWLGVWEHNQKAISFYQKNGFVAFSQHEFILGQDKQIDILMKKKL
ncbi:Ribosomal protein S18 acetylase RimI and related acetyltransferases (RimI) (PDB:1GHE) [Commensalibacter communis]|uniref:Ribosomal protein S18 acetylase RimI and related acetyltransferases (RimI) n=1 Tax=Commensalibacter communis TaxID=2972786 RepID=A0A9W4TRJ5_9PROT|nr:GNAT family N-acetyltransferase [Commensalibacter communis]CAI3922308.1 Ribosomal protein S18 acetylase RimI and related acetyltransferases (RimI) (PDB:1GHE) [Commensalibacter communis]CAI3943741.1 Ribosomal protein S18 acetylase RimI and related acetyltransferases (RimI) (PDB:1GHE) [Commensalibacter communis]CAI3950794.1 Ribosomal protein S18 acetylase RimI and related acetyltransferases (RimI) (PDB:1GHE) [Commensalibacter communis]CAI3952416.1 Ribosomal protein S18 acetylase RimI and relat